MNESILKSLIKKSLKKPPEQLLTICGDYYSPYYHFFMLAARHLRQGLLVELGIDQGRGLAALAMSDLPVVGIDHTRKVGLEVVMDLFPNITYLKRDSLPVPEYFDGKQISFLHIDTEHSYSQAQNEFESYLPYLTSPALVVFDDLHAQEDSVLKYFEGLPYIKIQDDRLHPTCGWGVIIYSEAEDVAAETVSDSAD